MAQALARLLSSGSVVGACEHRCGYKRSRGKYSVRPVALVNLNAPLHVKVHNNRRSSGIRARTRCTVRRTPVGYPVAITVHACLSSFHTHCCYSLELALKQVALDSSRCSSSFPSTATPMCIVLVKCLNILLRGNHVVAPACTNVFRVQKQNNTIMNVPVVQALCI